MITLSALGQKPRANCGQAFADRPTFTWRYGHFSLKHTPRRKKRQVGIFSMDTVWENGQPSTSHVPLRNLKIENTQTSHPLKKNSSNL